MGSSTSKDASTAAQASLVAFTNGASLKLAAYGQQYNAAHENIRTASNATRVLMTQASGVVRGGWPTHTVNGGAVFGGNEVESSAIGAKILQEFKARRLAKADESKAELVRKLAEVLNKLNFSINTGASLEEVAAEIVRKLPDPRKGKSFGPDAESQKQVCRAVADALNAQFTPGSSEKLIDVKLSPSHTCRQVADLMYAFSTGVCMEFLEVHQALELSMRNATVALEILKGLQSEGVKRIRMHVNEEDSREADAYLELIPKFTAELERLLKQLGGLLHVELAPAKAEIEAAMVEQTDAYKRLLKGVDKDLGSGEFGNALAYMMAGMGGLAKTALTTRAALKEIGLSVEQFSTSDGASLEGLMNEKFKGNPDNAGKLVRAIRDIRTAFSRKDADLVKEMKDQEVSGAAEKKSKLEREEDIRKTERKLILKQYLERSQAAYDKFLAAVRIVGPRLGKDIEVANGTALDTLRDALTRIDSVNIPQLDLSLIGLYTNAAARSARQTYLNHLRLVRNAVDDVMASEMYSRHGTIFRPIQEAIDMLIETIEFYSDIVTKKYGGDEEPGGEVPIDDDPTGEVDYDMDDGLPQSKPVGVQDADDQDITGGDEYDPSELEMTTRLRSSLDMRTAINSFMYYFFTAKVEVQLKATVPELERYGEKYNEVLGDAVAGRIIAIEEQYKLLLVEVGAPDGVKIGERPGYGKVRITDAALAETLWAADATALAAVVAGAGDSAQFKQAQDNWDASKKLLTEELQVKKEFYRLLQAVDLRMKEFAKGIASDIQSVSDIKASLNGVNVIAKWFTEATGDDLAAFFDETQRMNANVGDDKDVETRFPDGPPAHYYEKVRTTLNAVGTGGSFPSTRTSEVRGHLAKALNNFQALKNLMNAFARLGSKFGEKDLEKETFMNSAKMYQIMVRFLRVSSTGVMVTPGTPGATLDRVSDVNFGGSVYRQSEHLREGVRRSFVTPIADKGDLRNNWAVEHKFFHFIIKAIAAKILVVVGVFDMLERPDSLIELRPTRLILGAAENVEVIPAATELYFRLPRLAEFYKDLLGWNNAVIADQNRKIAMLPELQGVFSALIAEIYVRAEGSSSTGSYSDIECDHIIAAINQIYDHYRSHGDKAVQVAIEDFIKEINRRYGIVKQSEYEIVLKRQRGRYLDMSAMTNLQSTETNYAILPDEESTYLTSDVNRLAPADRYASSNVSDPANIDRRPGEYDIGDPTEPNSMWNFVKEFRDKLASKLTTSFGSHTISFRAMLERSRKAIEGEAESKKRLDLVYQLIQGSELIANSDMGRSLMFHETVILGLNTLTAIHDVLANFRNSVNKMDINEAIRRLNVRFSTSIDHATLMAAPGGARARAHATFNALLVALMADSEGTFAPRYIRGAGVAAKVKRDFAQMAAVDNARTEVGINTFFEGNCHGPETPALKSARAAAARMAFDRQAIMKDLILSLFQLTGDLGELVTVRYPGGASTKIHLDFSKVRDLVEGLMVDVRKYLEIFRPYIKSDVLNRYENSTERGSIGWLEQHLVDNLIKGLTSSAGVPYEPENTLEGIARKVNRTMVELTKQHKVHLTLSAAAAIATVDSTTDEQKFDQYGHVLAGMLFWDVNLPDSGVPVSVAIPSTMSQLFQKTTEDEQYTASSAKNVGLRSNGSNNAAVMAAARLGLGVGVDPTAAQLQAARAASSLSTYAPTWESANLTASRSMLFMFNQLLMNYVLQYYDPATGKIYQGLIDSFANGSFSQSVMQDGFSQPDLYAGATAFAQRGDPTGQSVLMFSVAVLMRRLMKEQTSQGVSRFLVSSLAEIPPYIKENYRGSLPVYDKLFSQLIKEGDLIKSLIQRAGVKCGRTQTMVTPVPPAAADTIIITAGAEFELGGIAGPNWANWPVNGINNQTMLKLGVMDTNTDTVLSPRFTAVIDAITAGCFTMTQTTQSVLRELADEPIYLQTSESSIQEYSLRNAKKLPLMPLSLMAFSLQEEPPVGGGELTHGTMMPWHGTGSNAFKIQYGIRGIFGTKTIDSLDRMPGVKQILSDYNTTAQPRDRIEEGPYVAFANRVVTGVRYVVGLRSYRTALASSLNTFARDAILTSPPGGGVAAARQNDNTLVWSLRTNRNENQIVGVVEGSNQEDRVREIVAGLNSVAPATEASGNNRESERINNIIDMNIVPINVHALMRTIALAPLYNYGYTFEELSARYYQTTRDAIAGLNLNVAQGAGGSPNTTRGFFLKLLQDPFAPVSDSQYGTDPTQQRTTAAFFGRLCRGDNDLGMGRPKFISDQLFNKVLFQSIYPRTQDADESGPSGAVSRGRDNWGRPNRTLYGFLPQFNRLTLYLADSTMGRNLRATTRTILALNPLLAAGGNTAAATVAAMIAVDAGGGGRDARLSTHLIEFAAGGAAQMVRDIPDVRLVPIRTAYDINPAAGPDLRRATADLNPVLIAAGLLSPVLANAGLVAILTLTELNDMSNDAFDAAWTLAMTTAGEVIRGADPDTTPGNYTRTNEILAALALTGDVANQLDGGVGHVLVQPLGNLTHDRYDMRVILKLMGQPIPNPPAPLDRTATQPQVAAVAGALATWTADIEAAVCKAVFEYIDANPEVVAFRTQMARFVQAVSTAESAKLQLADRFAPGETGTDTDLDKDAILTYIADKAADEVDERVVPVSVGPAKRALMQVGKARFDTALVRSLNFIVNVWRLTRAKLAHELSEQRSIIDRGDAVVNSAMTEFGTNVRYGPNETAGENARFSERRLY